MNLEAFQSFLEDIEERSPHTIRAYLSDVCLFGRWFEQTNAKELTPQRVTPTDLREYRGYLQATQGYKATTVVRKLASISAWMQFHVGQDTVSGNPASGIRWPKLERKLAPKGLTRQEEYALLRAADEAVQLADAKKLAASHRLAVRNRSLVILMLNTGLRVQEACDLRLNDVVINERSGSITVWRKGFSEQALPLNKPARKALAEWLKLRPETELKQVFIGQRGDALSPYAFRDGLSDLVAAANIEHCTPHTLRHTFAHRVVKKHDIRTAAVLLGHKDINTTLIYTFPTEGELLEAVNSLE